MITGNHVFLSAPPCCAYEITRILILRGRNADIVEKTFGASPPTRTQQLPTSQGVFYGGDPENVRQRYLTEER
jgi:hypothetical protein